MSNPPLDSSKSSQSFAGLDLLAAAETGRNLLADAQEPRTSDSGQPKVPAPTLDQVPSPVPSTPDQAPLSVQASPDQAPSAVEARPGPANSDKANRGADASQAAPVADQKIQDMLAQAKQFKAHVVRPGEVVTVDDVNFNRQPAWNPHTIQKGPADTVDDIILDREGKVSINENKKTKSVNGTVSIGIEADAVHWSPLFLPQAQQDTIRTTVDNLRANHPQLHVPAPLSDVPWTCLAAPPQEGPEAVDPAMFEKLLDMNKLTDRIVAAVAGNEGNLATVVTDDAGFGWSIGMRQWNQHVGELPTLLGAMYKKDPCTFVKDFGPYASKIINNAGDPLHATVNETWIRHADFSALLGFSDAKHKHVNHVPDLQKALSDFQDVQVALSRQWVNGGIKLAKKYGFTSELGLAEVCDIVNQKGAGGAEKTLRLIPSAEKADESTRIQNLENAAHRPGGQQRLSSLKKQFKAETKAVD